MLIRMLLVVDSLKVRRRLQDLLDQSDVHVSVSRLRGNFWNHLARENCDILVIRENLIPAPRTKTIAQLRELPDRPDIIVLSDREDPEERAELLAAGCLAVLNDRLPDAPLRNAFSALIERHGEWHTNRVVSDRTQRPAQLSDFISASPSMQAFIELARRVVATDSALLILGETGVGKERLARAIHNEGPRAAGPFIAVNCAALPEALLESELFGHEEGSFTGATRARRGFFEVAHRGTIFLDEVGEMPPHLQVKLLRVLQEYEIQRVGSEKTIPVDVRIMAATNRDLESEIAAKRFRQDLYYRLAVVTLTVPPLRDRREDILDLADSYITHFNLRLGRNIEAVSEGAQEGLLNYPWPGNVRELINVMERAVLLCSGSVIALGDLPLTLAHHLQNGLPRGPEAASPAISLPLPGDLMEKRWPEARRQVLELFERMYLMRLLQSTGGRIGESADYAGIQPRSLFTKMKHHGLRKEDFKPRRQSSS